MSEKISDNITSGIRAAIRYCVRNQHQLVIRGTITEINERRWERIGRRLELLSSYPDPMRTGHKGFGHIVFDDEFPNLHLSSPTCKKPRFDISTLEPEGGSEFVYLDAITERWGCEDEDRAEGDFPGSKLWLNSQADCYVIHVLDQYEPRPIHEAHFRLVQLYPVILARLETAREQYDPTVAMLQGTTAKILSEIRRTRALIETVYDRLSTVVLKQDEILLKSC
jgi:hypothetical protein